MVQAGAINAAALVARQLIADADEIEETRRFPATITDALIASGMLRMLLPKVYGGGEVDPGT